VSQVLLDRTRSWSPDDRAEQQLRRIDFEVPAGVSALEVVLGRPDVEGAVVDLGLEGPSGFIGWSGSARPDLVVSETWSTPGYLAAPPEPGTWSVLLGLHRVPASGATTHVTVTAVDEDVVQRHQARLPVDPPPAPRPPRRDLPGLDGMTWLAGDFHAHTVHSDGALTVGALARLAVTRGLDFLAVTDHNTTAHHAELDPRSRQHGIRLLLGQEVTRDTGHANAFGDIGFVDFRTPPSTWGGEVASRGGLLSVNHPLAGDCAWLHSPPGGPKIAEMWHSSWSLEPTWGAPLAWWRAWGPDTIPLGGSDYHHDGADGPPGSPMTWVLAQDDDVLAAVQDGRTAVSATRDGPVLLRLGDELVALDADGLLLCGFDGPRRRVRGEVARWSDIEGPSWLEDGTRAVHALSP